jgi:cytochrome c peroxidase
MSSRLVFVLILVVVLALVGYWYYRAQQELAPPAKPVGAAVALAAPLGLPPVPVPADNPPTADTIALGRRLYYDPLLSVDNTVACASCHHPDFGFSDGKQFSEGVQGKKGGRNAPTVFNAAYYTTQFWDGRAPSLEEQAAGPMQNPVEMAHTLAGVEEKLNADAGYREEFKRAFGSDRITIGMVTKAIASFERTVVSGNSPFDRYFYGGDKQALSPSARRGLEVFRDPKKGNCTACHTIGEKDALFTDNKFHNLGVGVVFDKSGEPVMKDLGRYDVTKQEADKGAFKTPSLRNIALTAPYMHDGSLKTLKDVIDFYVGGGTSNPHLDKEVRALDFLTGQERADLLAFLESLTGEMPANVGPPEKK